MSPMAELEIDDVAFLTGDSRTHSNLCDVCLCGRSVSSSNSRTRRRSKTSPSGLSALFSVHCGPRARNANVQTRRRATILTCVLCSLIVSLIALYFAFLGPSFLFNCSNSDKTDQRSNGSSSTKSEHLSSPSKDSKDTNVQKRPPCTATNGEAFPWASLRLPSNNVLPVHYELFMHPNLTTFTNKGTVEILLSAVTNTNYIVIHVKQLNITAIAMSVANQVVPIKRVLECRAQEQLFVEFNGHLEPHKGNYSLKVSFNKKLAEQLDGFYVSSYNDSSSGVDRKRYLATTHFEPTSARKAFPCFDEPLYKATFSMKMVHEPNYDVYFNSERQTKLLYNPDGHFLSVFEDTVRMSTYLVAFAVCDFKAMSARTKEGVHVRVLVPNDQYNQAEYALYSASNMLTYYHEFFNVSYPMSKLDLMAIPDFASGAMENWGLVSFRTTMILFNEAESSNQVQEQVATVIAHELGHQWFGNLVTMSWWSELWLNEGFATYMEHLGVNYVHPDWLMMEQFILTTTQDAMNLDSLDSSHSIMAAVENTNDIDAIFDSISYKKGAALIRMLQNFLGMDTLRSGLTKYLTRYQFRNAQTRDLWTCLSESVPHGAINVSAILDRWVKQKGYPVIATKLEYNKLYLSQRRFLSSPTELDDFYLSFTSPLSNQQAGEQQSSQSVQSPFGYQWIVPITIITNRNPVTPKLVWLSSPDAVLSMDSATDWFKINTNQTGFYRVNYDESNWRKLIELLHSRDHRNHVLSATDRASLIDDAFSLMKISLLTSDLALNLSSYLENAERHYVPWETALRHFAALDVIMNGNPYLHKYIMKLLLPTLTTLGWKDDGSHLDRKLRSSILFAAVKYGDENTIKIARRFFEEWTKNNYRVSPNFRETVYMSGIKFGNIRDWEFCWKKYKNSKIASEKRLLLSALAATKSNYLLERLLQYSLDKDKIRAQDTVQVITEVSKNPAGKLVAWRFVRSNWATILELFGQGSFSMDSVITETSWFFSDHFDYQEVSNFFANVQTGSGQQAVRQVLERIRSNIYWKEHIEQQVVRWLQRVTYRL
ncbi:Glutamyl aminopeptidase [Halotydeus destructor]|nr:Glutamyl aminopeptidase [Halotydeus destructor]